jgi:hypothetical protein
MPSNLAVRLPEVMEPAQKEQVADIGKQARQALRVAQEMVVTGPAGEQEATEWLGFLAQGYKQAEGLRKAMVLPIKRAVASVDAIFKTATDPYAEAREVVEDKLRTYRAAVREEQARVQRELEAAEQARQAAQEAVLDTFGGETGPEAAQAEEKAVVAVAEAQAAAFAVPEVASTLHGSMGSAQTRMDWVFEVVKADDVPRAYCAPDEKLIRQAVGVGVRNIPGVRIYQKERFAVRGW